jgi:hypothetical protein
MDAEKMAPRGAIFVSVSIVVVTMLHDHYPVVMMPAMITMPAMIAHFGAGAVPVMIAVPNHDGFSTCDRWHRNGNRTKRGNDVSKLLHNVLLGYAGI